MREKLLAEQAAAREFFERLAGNGQRGVMRSVATQARPLTCTMRLPVLPK